MQILKYLKTKKDILLLFLPIIFKIMLLVVFLFMGLNVEQIQAKLFWIILIAVVGALPSLFKIFNLKNRLLILLVISSFEISVVELLNPCQFKPINIIYIVLTLLFVLGINSLVFALSNNLFVSTLISNTAILTLSLVNHYYYIYRGDPFEISEIQLIKTAMTVIGEYEFFIDYFVCLSIVLNVSFLISIYGFSKTIGKSNHIIRICRFVVGCLLVLTIFLYPIPILNMWDKTESVEQYGYIYSSVIFADATFNVDKPKEYDSREVKESLDKYESGTIQRTPNIICVMNEAFSDLPDTYDFETDVELLPVYNSLKENTQKGWLYVSTFGGGTSNTEFEFLTGNSMAFMPPSSVPYVQYIREEQQSIVSYLKKLGYTTIAYHPYYKKGYNRDMVYPLMGFDRFYSKEDEFESQAHIRWCLSDWSNYQNLFTLFEQKNGPIFMFNITMQNHGGYLSETDKVPVRVKAKNIQDDNLNEYLSLVNTSDSSILNLINYFSSVEEDTIVLFFGDHQPSLSKETYLKFDEKFANDSNNPDEKQKQVQVPFFIWANYDINEKEDLHISPNYLSVLLFESAGIPLTQYQQFLKELYKEYPVINLYGYNSKGKNYTWSNDEKIEIFDKYQNLVYANMFDKSKVNIEEWQN